MNINTAAARFARQDVSQRNAQDTRLGVGGPASGKNKVRGGRFSRTRFKKGRLGVRTSRDGSLSGVLRAGKDGQVRLPNGQAFRVPPGGVATHLLGPGKLLVLQANRNGLVSVSTKKLGVEVNEKKGTVKGHVLPRQEQGQRVVDLGGGLGSLLAPEKGKTDAYLLSPDKLLSLKSNEDGTVTVDTKTLGLEADKKGRLKGYLLPTDGKVDVGGKELDVSGLKPGKTKKKTVKIGGKKYKVSLRMNEDGTVTVQAKRKRGFFSKLAGVVGKVLNVVGKLAPFLAAIPGLGFTAVLAKVASGINAVKGFVQAIKSGNILGAVASLAGGVATFAKGALAAVADKVAKVAGAAQQVVSTLRYGLGKGLLQVVSNGASLLSGLAGALGGKQVARVAGDVANYAGIADAASRGNLLPALAQVANTLGRDALLASQRQQRELDSEPRFSIHQGVRFNTDPSRLDLSGFDFGHQGPGHVNAPAHSGGGGGGGSNILSSPGLVVASREMMGLGRFSNEARALVSKGLEQTLGVTREVADRFTDGLIAGLSTGKVDVKTDGYIIGASGELFPPKTKLGSIPGVTPEGGVRNGEKIIYTNGVLNDAKAEYETLRFIANKTGSEVVGNRNATMGPGGDLGQSAADKINAGNNEASKNLAHMVLTELYAGRGVHLMGHSQGALVTSRALFSVRNQLRDQGKSQQEVENIMSRIKVETFGGAARLYPDGPRYVHYVNNFDVIPLTFGIGNQSMQNLSAPNYGRNAQVINFNLVKDPLTNHDMNKTYLDQRRPF